jgi:predicted ATP-grasp superfamily ATP-dependent carboligase
MPWFYTGGVENYPDVVDAISEHHDLLGNAGGVLRQVRDPWYLQQLGEHFAPVEQICSHTPTLPSVRKPLRGSGGFGIRYAEATDRCDEPGYYYQQYINGESFSAIFQATADNVVSLGVTKQLIGTPWLHAQPFQYAGNISQPWELEPLGLWPATLAARTGLSGLFGIDYSGDPRRVLEVNPRYPASLEVLELASCNSLLYRTTPPDRPQRIVGKAIYYALETVRAPRVVPWTIEFQQPNDPWRVPSFADIPLEDTLISQGEPVLTMMAEAATEADVLRILKERATSFDDFFGFNS